MRLDSRNGNVSEKWSSLMNLFELLSNLILAYYQTAECIRLTLKELDIDVEKYEKENDLIIIQDSIETHSGYIEDFLSLLKTLDKQQEKRGKKGLSVTADMVFSFIFNIIKMF
ncbi:MAG: hypothetical protein ACTHKP_06800 [Nitrososphaeraceae archaeon]|jgi:hypothetical protein